MNANAAAKPVWRALVRPARAVRLMRAQAGFALYEALRRPGLPGRLANANARFEIEAKQAMREWLMV